MKWPPGLVGLLFALHRKGLALGDKFKFLCAWIGSWAAFIFAFGVIFFAVSLGFKYREAFPLKAVLEWVAFSVLLVFTVVVNVIVAAPDKKMLKKVAEGRRMWIWSGCAAAVTIGAVMLSTSTWWVIPELVMRAYGLGSVHDITILVSEDARQLRSFLSLPDDNSASGPFRVEKLTLLSRAGSLYLFETDTGVRFTLSKTGVLSLRVRSTVRTDRGKPA